jgi:starch phosphorylase
VQPGARGAHHETIGPGWAADLDRSSGLAPLADDAAVRARFAAIKRANKVRLAAGSASTFGVAVDPDALFDVQIKRIHEYKRQLLNALHVVAPVPPRPSATRGWTCRRGVPLRRQGRAGVPHGQAHHPLHQRRRRGGQPRPRRARGLKVLFVPNYSVSLAERIIPAADLSEQISTAGKEASGTGNMKFSMNGALTIGTLDGANIEIREAVGTTTSSSSGSWWRT